MRPPAPTSSETTVRRIAEGDGWRVSDIICRSGPDNAPFEETHQWMSIAAVIEGSFVYRSTHGRSLMAPGAILLGNQGACFCCSHEHGRGDRCIALHLDPALFEEVVADAKGVRAASFRAHRLPPHEALSPIFSAARTCLMSPSATIVEQAVLTATLHAVALAHDGAEQKVSLNDERRVVQSAALINTRFMEPLSLGELASELGVTRHHFLRIFRRVMGVTPYHYLLSRRLDAAMQRLRSSAEPVLTIALECGFGDLSEFTRRFRKRFGAPPAAYRGRSKHY
jgi:AraC family transcriptional regulator